MKKHLILAAATTLFVLAAPLANAAPALVINPAGSCGLLDGNGGFAFTTDTKIIVTQSDNNNSKLTCKATVTPSSAGNAARFDSGSTGGLPCGFFTPSGLQLTDQWNETVSASGEATLTCHVTGKP